MIELYIPFSQLTNDFGHQIITATVDLSIGIC